MSQTREAIRRALEQVRVIDPHCHLRPHKPAADNLADIVLYHHVWIELVSAGMGQYEVTKAGLPQELEDPGMSPLERVRRALPYLSRMENTTLGLLLRWLLQDLYGVESLTEGNLEQVAALAEERGRDHAWQKEVLRERCGIETSITVEPGIPYGPGMHLGVEGLPINIADGKRSPQQVLAALEARLGREIRSAADYRELLAKVVRELPLEEYRFIGLWPLPHLSAMLAGEKDVSRTLARAREGLPLSPEAMGGFSYYAITSLLEELRPTAVRTVQVIVGAEVLPPHRALTHWSGSFVQAMGRIACAYEDFRFNLSSASDLYTQDLAILAKHIPNISVAGYWWHTFYPHYIRKSLETRLDIVPGNKIIAYFSDAYHAEWCYPKLLLVKKIAEDVLTERVERGWYSLGLALDLVERLFYCNAKEIYGL